ncbi:PAS domain-containing protein [Streptomyces sp. NPDC004111]|uniref:PAS domain-containing protein n=1 Tax=Streptomyces sp. NPDC004111 TaxID=3364690 RepID=UPI0036B52CA9
MVPPLSRGTARLAAISDALPESHVSGRRDGAAGHTDPAPRGRSGRPGSPAEPQADVGAGTEDDGFRSAALAEAILRAATEGIACTDTAGRIVRVSPSFAQLLGHGADELRGAALHPLVLARRPDGTPFPYEESPLADTLRSGRKHRVRGQVLRSRSGERVPADLTTAPVRDGDRIVGAVMTFTDRGPYEKLVQEYAAELAALTDRAEQQAAERAERARQEEQEERYTALAARHAELAAVLASSLRGELDDRLTEGLVDHQRLAAGTATVTRHPMVLGDLVTNSIHKATALTGPHRTPFAVHAPSVVVVLDPVRATTALAHLIADACGYPSSGAGRPRGRTGGRADTTVVITADQYGDVLRIEIRGPRAVEDPAHMLIARGIVDAHGGTLTALPLPGGVGLTHVVELPTTAVPIPGPGTTGARPPLTRPALPAPAAAAAPAPHPAPAPVRAPHPAPAPVRAPHPAPAPVRAAHPAQSPAFAAHPVRVPVPLSRPVAATLPAPAPIAGSLIIGAAVRAHHARSTNDLPVRARSVPLPSPPSPDAAPAADVETERIVTLLARLRNHPA